MIGWLFCLCFFPIFDHSVMLNFRAEGTNLGGFCANGFPLINTFLSFFFFTSVGNESTDFCEFIYLFIHHGWHSPPSLIFYVPEAVWFKRAMKPSTGPLACLNARSLTLLIHLLAPHCLLCSYTLLRSFVRSLAHSLTLEFKVND